MSADNNLGRFWSAQDNLRIHRPSVNTYDGMLRAQARIEDWLERRGEFSREAVREMMLMVVGGEA